MNLKTIYNQISPPTECKKCPIRESSLFQGVTDEHLEWTQKFRKKQIMIPARTRLFQEGENHEFVYSMFSGWGILYKTVSNNGKRQILRFLLPGDLIGYQTNSSKASFYSAGSVTESILCAFSHNKINSMLKENPDLAMRLVAMEMRDLSLCQSHLMAAGRKTAKESVAFVLLELFYRVQSQTPHSYNSEKNSIYFPITQEDIGDAVGLTNVHVNRVIKELMNDKLITCHKKELTILDEKSLCKIAEFSPDLIKGHPLL